MISIGKMEHLAGLEEDFKELGLRVPTAGEVNSSWLQALALASSLGMSKDEGKALVSLSTVYLMNHLEDFPNGEPETTLSPEETADIKEFKDNLVNAYRQGKSATGQAAGPLVDPA